MIKLGSKLKILKTASKATALLPNGQISKVASAEDNSEYSNDFLYFIARALTANVPNANGDYFPEDELQKSYQSFIGKNLHLNHDADDVAKAVGKIIDAWFVKNEDDIYVVCLCKIDKKLHPELARNIETGIIDSVSMGCSCQECECSICGCKAHNESEMCDHLKNFLGREITVNGKTEKVSSINRGITFNELSLVGDPADSNAHMYQIYASKKQGDNMNKKAMQDGKTEDVVQDEVKQEIEKTLKDKEETETKAEETAETTKAEVKEEIKEVEDKLKEVKEIVEEKKEELKDLKEDVKEIKEEKKEEVVEEKKEETEEKVEKEESCKKAETEDKTTYTVYTAIINDPTADEAEKRPLVEDGDEFSVISLVNEYLKDIESKKRATSIEEALDIAKKEGFIVVTKNANKNVDLNKKAESEEEIKDIEEIKEKAEEAVKEDKEKTETETETETKEEVVEETKEEKKDDKAETLEEVQEKVEEIKEEVVAEIGDLFSPVKDETKEFAITDIFEDNGEKFVETEVEGKKKVYALKNVKVKKNAKTKKIAKSVKELSREELIELKQSYYTGKHKNVSWGELAEIDNLVSDEEIFKEYADTEFVDEDFFVNSSKNVKLEKSAKSNIAAIYNNVDGREYTMKWDDEFFNQFVEEDGTFKKEGPFKTLEEAKENFMKKRPHAEEIVSNASKDTNVEKQAEAPAKPTTAPSAGMKWVFNKNTNAWEQKPENTKTVEVEAMKEYKYTLIKASKQPRWLVIDKATNKIAQKLYLKDLPKEAESFAYKTVIAKTIAENGLDKVAAKLGVSKTAIKADDKYTLTKEDGSTEELTVKSISINDVTKETFINVQIGGGEGDNIFSLSKFMKMMEEGQLQKVEEGEKVEEVKEETVVEETAENNVETTEDTVPMNPDETAEPLNDLQSARKNKVQKKAEITLDKDEQKQVKKIIKNFSPVAVKYEGDSEEGYSVLIKDKKSNFSAWVDVWINESYYDVETDWNQYIFSTNSTEDRIKSAVQDDTETVYDLATSVAIQKLEEDGLIVNGENGWTYGKGTTSSTKVKVQKKADAGDGQLVPQSDPTPDFKVAPEVKPNETNTLANGESASPEGVIPEKAEELTPKQQLQAKITELAQAIENVEDDKLGFIEKEIQDAIDYVAGKPIEEIENDEQEIAEFTDIKWEESDNAELPMVASVDVDDINWNNINARKDGAMILAHIYKAKPVSYKVAFKKVNKMNKTAAKITKVAFVDVLKAEIDSAKQEVEVMKMTAQIKEKKEECVGIAKEAEAKGLIDSSEYIKKFLIKGMSHDDAREMAVKQAADEYVKSLMAMDKVSLANTKKMIANFKVPVFKTKSPSIGRITASCDYDEEITQNLPWSRKR